jgi:CrcB protein
VPPAQVDEPGSLTTFSTFSAEAVELLSSHQYGWGILLIGSHLAGSLLMTLLGMLAVRSFVIYF